MEKGILIPANTGLPTRAIEFEDINSAREIANNIAADLIERVRIGDFRETPPESLAPVIMLVDEEGVLRDRAVNLRASVLYGATQHGQLIRGPVVLVIEYEEFTSEGPDILSLIHISEPTRPY